MKPLVRTFPAAVATLAVAPFATACSAGDDAGAAAGRTLRIGMATSPECLDPQQAGTSAALNIGRQLVDSLTDQDPRTGEIKPHLAASWKVDRDSTAFTFTLVRGATFSDGEPVDAAAVKANFDNVVKLGAKALLGSAYLAGYRRTTVIDAQTARVEFAKPSAQFLQATSTVSLGLLAPRSFDSPAPRRCQAAGLIGSGPFTFKSLVQNQQVVLVKRPGYAWGSGASAHHGEAYLDRITYVVVPEAGARAGALESGQVDAITDVAPGDQARFRGGGFTEVDAANPGIPYNLQPNTSRPALNEEKVRQALQLGIDRKAVVDTVLTPSYKPATGALAATTPGYVDLRDQVRYDPARAGALLDEAGWKPGPDGVRVKNGRPLRLGVVYPTSFDQNQPVLELIQQQVRKIGVGLTLRQGTPGQLARLAASGDYDLAWSNLTRSDPDVLRPIFSTKYVNRSYLKPNPLDDLLDRQAAQPQEAERRATVAEAQRLIIGKGYLIPIFEAAQVLAFSHRVRGLSFGASTRIDLYDARVGG
ncbi:ABC transporter substrate-binding protein [Actinomadura gamaensis]|uniref:ABC transporter substrate-binding protein n=1 Tax=Actinomadura gamaensis TaxID=1763541 RepID=A0ABV9TXU5_9ACTN